MDADPAAEILFVTEQELKNFADTYRIPSIFLIMPLPNRQPMSNCRINHHDKNRWLGFETDTGKSGWCCPYCGVIHCVRQGEASNSR